MLFKCSDLSYLFIFIFTEDNLLLWKEELQRNTERSLWLISSLSKCIQWPGLSQEARNQELPQDFSHGSEVQAPGSSSDAFPGLNRVLDQKHTSWDSTDTRVGCCCGRCRLHLLHRNAGSCHFCLSYHLKNIHYIVYGSRDIFCCLCNFSMYTSFTVIDITCSRIEWSSYYKGTGQMTKWQMEHPIHET